MRLNEKGLPSEKIFEAAKVYLSDYQAKYPSKMKQPKENVKWQPPVEGLYKTNYDGAVFTESGEARIGIIVRDVRGEVIAALAKKILYPRSVDVLEALAARRAVICSGVRIIFFNNRRRLGGGLQGVAGFRLASFIHW